MYRAYSILEVKAIDDEARTFAGIATTPAPDSVDDVIEPLGVSFTNPLALLLRHDHSRPIGTAKFGTPSSTGIPFEAHIPNVREPGVLKDRTDEAWHSVKYGVMRGVSVGIKARKDDVTPRKSGGLHFHKCNVYELSVVPIPANLEATITSIKSLDADDLAAMGMDPGSSHSPGGSGRPVVRLSRPERTMKTIADQISGFENKRAANVARMTEIQNKASEEGRSKDDAEKQEYQTLKSELTSIDEELVDLREMAEVQKAQAVPVVGKTPEQGTQSRAPVITVEPSLPPGIGLARYAIAQINARKNGSTVMEFAKTRWPDDSRLHAFITKAAVPAGTTTNATWAGNLVDQTNLASEFLEYLRPRTIVGRIPGLRRVPFNVRVTGQSTGAVANWVGAGKAKPVTSFGTSATTLLWTKIAAIAVITEELARFSAPSAEALVRDELARAVIERMDIDFIDPAQAAVANVSPASITNGVTPLTPSGTSADNARTDLTNLISLFIENNLDPSNLVLIMPNSLALALSLMVNSLGQPSFTGINMSGGTLLGIPVVASQYAANASGSGNLVIALDASAIFLADDGNVTLDASREASIEMSDAPLGDATVPTASSVSVVSMYQTNSIAIRAERFINWAKARTTAVQFIDDVNWGSVGSPA